VTVARAETDCSTQFSHRFAVFGNERMSGDAMKKEIPQGDNGYRLAKRCVDLGGATVLCVAAAPLMLCAALAVRLSSRGPILFSQKRLTEGGTEFALLKFRTMKQDAEATTGATLASENDDRITSVGRILRKTRIDELPQLFNVIQGDMSLIGPRPERPELAKEFEARIPGFSRRLRVKAGLTGLAQVIQGYPRYIDGYRQKLAFDLVYIKRQSLVLDAWIALKTVGVVISGSGAR
jgi:lipopolysaccharide/colanic/teichoic acid biosynthesis glycosyltransferase